MGRAQYAVELTVLIALIILVLLFVFDFGENTLIESASMLQVSQARSSVDRLSKAVTEVHNEGVGARRLVFVTIPDRINASHIVIANNKITLGVYSLSGTNDVSAPTDFPIQKGGFFPTLPGNYWVWVISRQGYAQVGSALFVNPLSVYTEIFSTSSSDTNVTITNLGTSPINVTMNLSWADSEVSATINGTAYLTTIVPANTSNVQNIDVNAAANQNASRGFHTGYINITTNVSDSEIVPLLVNVVGPPSNSTGVYYMAVDTYNGSDYTHSNTTFSASKTVFYRVRSYNSTDEPVNTTITVRVYNTTSSLMNEATYSANNGTGVYTGSYTLPASAPIGTWEITTYETGGASVAMYFTVQ